MKDNSFKVKDQGFIPSTVFFHCLRGSRLQRKIKVEVQGRKWVSRINKINDKENRQKTKDR
jgi:hypothetical protein